MKDCSILEMKGQQCYRHNSNTFKYKLKVTQHVNSYSVNFENAPVA